jgi:hypothetical protein
VHLRMEQENLFLRSRNLFQNTQATRTTLAGRSKNSLVRRSHGGVSSVALVRGELWARATDRNVCLEGLSASCKRKLIAILRKLFRLTMWRRRAKPGWVAETPRGVGGRDDHEGVTCAVPIAGCAGPCLGAGQPSERVNFAKRLGCCRGVEGTPRNSRANAEADGRTRPEN